MRIIPTFLLVLSIVTGAYSFDCRTLNKYELYINSNVIFMGKIENVQSSNFTVRVYETFKGELRLDTVLSVVLSEESILPVKNELWLLYGEKDRYGSVFVSTCGGSRKFNWPYSEGFNVINYFEPPPQGVANSESLAHFEKMWQNRALNELYFDVLNLRQMKLKKMLQELESRNTIDIVSVQDKKLSKIILLDYLLIGLMVILGILATVIVFKSN